MGGGHHGARRQGQAGHARAGERDDAGAHGGRSGVVQVGGGLVQEDEPGAPVRAGGAQPRQRPGQGDAPQLAGAELHGPPVRRAVQGDGGEHRGALGVRTRPAGRRVELLAHRGLEQARMLADPHGAVRVHAAHAPLHAGVRGAQQSREQVQEGGLAGAGGRAEHGERARRRAQVHALQDAPVPEGHADVLEDHRAGRGRRGTDRARRCGGGVRERVPGRLGHGRPRGGAGPALGLAAVLGGVVRAADVAQGQVHLGGQHEDHEPGAEVHLPVDEAQADEHGHHGHGERGDQLEGHAGDERGAQGAQSGGVVPLRGPLEGAALDAGPAQPHEHGQSAGELHEVAGEAVQPVLGGVDPLLRVPADEDHEEGHERDGQQHHEGGERVPGEDPGAEDRGHDGGGGQGRQDLGVVVVQALQAVGDQHGVRARAGARAVRGGQAVGHEVAAHAHLHAERGAAAPHPLAGVGQGAQPHAGGAEREGPGERRRRTDRPDGRGREEEHLEELGRALGVERVGHAGQQAGERLGEQDPARGPQRGEPEHRRDGAARGRAQVGAAAAPGAVVVLAAGPTGRAVVGHTGSTAWGSGMWVSRTRRRNTQ